MANSYTVPIKNTYRVLSIVDINDVNDDNMTIEKTTNSPYPFRINYKYPDGNIRPFLTLTNFIKINDISYKYGHAYKGNSYDTLKFNIDLKDEHNPLLMDNIIRIYNKIIREIGIQDPTGKVFSSLDKDIVKGTLSVKYYDHSTSRLVVHHTKSSGKGPTTYNSNDIPKDDKKLRYSGVRNFLHQEIPGLKYGKSKKEEFKHLYQVCKMILFIKIVKIPPKIPLEKIEQIEKIEKIQKIQKIQKISNDKNSLNNIVNDITKDTSKISEPEKQTIIAKIIDTDDDSVDSLDSDEEIELKMEENKKNISINKTSSAPSASSAPSTQESNTYYVVFGTNNIEFKYNVSYAKSLLTNDTIKIVYDEDIKSIEL